MAKFYGGLDLGSSVCEFVVIDESEVEVYHVKCPPGRRELVRHVREFRQQHPGELHVAFEEGELAQWAAGVLRPYVTRVIVCDPRRNAWIARDSQKNDAVDARKLARLLKGGFLHEIYHPEDQLRIDFKRAVQHYHDITQNQAALKCQIKARYRAEGVIFRESVGVSPEKREETLAQLPHDTGRQFVRQLYDLLEATRKIQEQAHRLMVALGRSFPEVRQFQEVPGIGPVWACTFSAYIQTPARFRNKRKLWRFCKLGITNRQSNGEPLGRQRLDRSGVGILKSLSFRAFCAAQRGDNEFSRHYAESLKRTSNHTHARLSTQRKILAVLYGMWKRHEDYRSSRPEGDIAEKNVKTG